MVFYYGKYTFELYTLFFNSRGNYEVVGWLAPKIFSVDKDWETHKLELT